MAEVKGDGGSHMTHNPTGMTEEEARKWQPIETAPKDGTEIIVKRGGKTISLGWYFRSSSRFEGWCDHNGNGITPTHWIPMPTLPLVSGALND